MTSKTYKVINASHWGYDVLRKLAEKNNRTITGQLDICMEHMAEIWLDPAEVPPKPAPTPKEVGLA